jgi:phospholipid/cholesterol/gamma-HCH transport system permease protein
MVNIFGYTGRKIIIFLEHTSGLFNLLGQTLYWIFIKPRRINFGTVLQQMEFIGVNSIPIVSFVSLFFGITLAMLTSYQLEKVGSELLVGGLVGVSFTRELGPLLTALVVAARVGAAITAELGTMKVGEEVDALETMAMAPVRFLIAPRLIAIFFMLPLLVIISNIMGIIGGYIIGYADLHMNSGYFFRLTFDSMVLKDIYTGLCKSFFFAVIIGMVGCYQGFIVKGGAEGVGKATTISVVTSIELIIITDAFLNAVFYFF